MLSCKGFLDAQLKITKINKARQADGEEKQVHNEDNDPQLIGEAKTAMHDMLDITVNHSSDQLGTEELNADQRCICDTMPLALVVSKVERSKTSSV